MDELQNKDAIIRLENDLLRKIAQDPEHAGFDYALPVMIEAVDAALWEFFARFVIKDTALERRSITSGSVQYVLMHANKRYTFGIFHVRLVAPDVTVIALQYGTIYTHLLSEQAQTLKGLLTLIAHVFVRWFQEGSNAACVMAMSLVVAREPRAWMLVDQLPPDLPEPEAAMARFAAALESSIARQPRRPGGTTDPDNDWARAEVRLGRERADVFAEYLRRQNVDQADEQAVRHARNRFKKALTRAMGRK